MIGAIIKFAVRNKGVMFLLMGILIALGGYSVVHLPIDAVPDITNNQVQINTNVSGWSAEEIEKTVTFPVEAAVRGIPHTQAIRSLSRLGLSQVTIIFEDSMDIYRARQLVAERLQGVQEDLPDGVAPELGPISTGLGEIYQYVVEFKDIATDPAERFQQLVELKTIQEWFIQPRLVGVAGVAEVNNIGGFGRQLHIIPDPHKMATYGIAFSDLENAVSNATQNVGGGYIEQQAEQFVVQAVGMLQNAEDILPLPIMTLPNMQVVSIGEVAAVREGKELRNGTAIFNGRETVLGTVMMMTGENSRVVAERVATKLQEIAKDLPSKLEIIPVYSRSDLVNATISTVWHNVSAGAVLVIVVLFVLIGNMRAAFITAITIPLTFLVVVTAMKYANISGNLMSMGALDFGIVIDSVVIIVDHCLRKLQQRLRSKSGLTQAEIDQIVIDATTEIRRAAGFGQLILVMVFLPIFALTGIEAKTFQPMAITFIIALLGTLVLSLTITPALIALLLGNSQNSKEPRIMVTLEHWYQRLLPGVLRHPTGIIYGAIMLICVGIGLFRHLGVEFIPQLKEGALAFHMIRPQNVSLSMSIALQEKAEKLLLSYPEVSHTFTRIGTAEVATDPMGVNVSDTYVIFKDFGKGVNFDRLAEDMIERLEHEVPGMLYLASQPIQMRFNELLEGSRADLSIKIFGSDLAKLEEIGTEVEELVKQVSATSDVELDRSSGANMLVVEPKLQALKQYGVKKAEILDTIAIALAGREVGYMFEQDRRFPVVIRLDDEIRKDLNTLNNLPIPVLGDTIVPLGEIANLDFRATYGTITRDNGNRRATIMANIRGMDTKTFVEQAQQLVQEHIRLPEGYFIEWGGQYQNLQAASTRLSALVPLTLLIIFAMLYLAFNSLKKALLIFMSVPFAILGGIFSLYLSGLNFSIAAAIGFIALMGISIMDGIVLINAFDSAEYNGFPFRDRVMQAATSRLRAVLMTTLTDFLGFLPMAISSGIGAEVQRPLAVVVIGGTITSTLLTLIVLPTIYYQFSQQSPEAEMYSQ